MQEYNNLFKKLGTTLSYITKDWDYDTQYYLKTKKIGNNLYEDFLDNDLTRFLYGKNIFQYCETLCKGWIAEDIVLNIIKHNFKEVKLTGKDKNREFIFYGNYGLTELDLNLLDIDLDVQSDFTGYFKRNNSVSLNFEKVFKFKEDDILILLDVNNCKMAFIKPFFCKKEKVMIKTDSNIYKYELQFDYNKDFFDINLFYNRKFLIKQLTK